jgi:DNA-directed RNA polymerase specialized sigma24 family protein
MEVALPAISADDAAMSQVAAGDPVALAWLFDTHKARLFGFLFHLVGDRALAEDLLGESFLHLYETRSSYRVGRGFTPWLFILARNLAIRELRRNGMHLRAHSRLASRLFGGEHHTLRLTYCARHPCAAVLIVAGIEKNDFHNTT